MPSIEATLDARKMRSEGRAVVRTLDDVGDAAGRAGRRVDGVDRELDKVGRTAGQVARGLVVGAAALATFVAGQGIRGAITNFAEFDLTLAQVGQVSSATADQLTALEEAALGAGSTTSFTASQAGDGLLFLARAGFTAEQAVGALNPTLDLATAANIGLGESADIVSNALSQYRLGVDQTSRATDALIGTANRANTDVLQLGQALSVAGPIAQAFGVSLEGTNAALGVLGDAGIQATRAGTGLNNVLRGLSSVGPQGVAALAEIGLTAEDVDVQTVGLVTALERLNEAGLGASAAEDLFGRIGQAAGLNLAQGVDKVRELTAELENNDGAAADAAAVIGGTLSKSFDGLGSAIEGAQIRLGQSGLGGGVQAFVDTAADSVRLLAGFERATDASDGSVRILTASVLALTGAIGVGGLTAAAAGAATVLPAVVGGIAAFLGPVGLAVTGVGALGGALAGFLLSAEDATEGVDGLNASLANFETFAATIERRRVAFELDIEEGDLDRARGAIDAIGEELRSVSVAAAIDPSRLFDTEALRAAIPQLDDAFLEIEDRLLSRIRGATVGGLSDGAQAGSIVFVEQINAALEGLGGENARVGGAVQEAIESVIGASLSGATGSDLSRVVLDALGNLEDGFSITSVSGERLQEVIREISETVEQDLGGAIRNAELAGTVNPFELLADGARAAASDLGPALRDIVGGVFGEIQVQADEAADTARGKVETFIASLEFEASIASESADAQERLRTARQIAADAASLGAEATGEFQQRAQDALDTLQSSDVATRAYSRALDDAASSQDRYRQSVVDSTSAVRADIQALEFELSLIGQSSGQIARARAERQNSIDVKALEEIGTLALADAQELLADAVARGDQAGQDQAAQLRQIGEEALEAAGKVGTLGTKVADLAEGLDNSRQQSAATQGAYRDIAGAVGSVAFQAQDAGEAVENLLTKFAQTALENSIFALLSGGFGGGNTILGNILSGSFGSTASAKGNLFSGPIGGASTKVTPFQNGGLLSGPVAFPLSDGIGLAAEKAPNFEELLLPVVRDGGEVKVKSAGGGGSMSISIDQRGSNFKSRREARTTARQAVRQFEASTRRR